MNNFAKELQEKIDQARQWAALSIVGKATDIFISEICCSKQITGSVKKDLD